MAILLSSVPSPQPTNTSFDLGREFRINQEFSIPSGDSVIYKIVLGVNTLLTFSQLEIDQGGIKYAVYTSLQTTETSAFNTVVPIYRKNNMSTAPVVTSLNNIYAGGGANFTGVPNTVIRIRTSSGNASRSSAVSTGDQQRGFPPTTIYLEMSSLEGINTTSTGVFNLEWTEK